MSRELLNSINVTLDGYSILISLIIAISILSIKKVESSAKWFGLTNVIAIIYGISDIFKRISDGTNPSWKLITLPVSTFVYYFAGGMLFLFYLRYLIEYYSNYEKLHKRWWYIGLGTIIVYNIFVFIFVHRRRICTVGGQ